MVNDGRLSRPLEIGQQVIAKWPDSKAPGYGVVSGKPTLIPAQYIGDRKVSEPYYSFPIQFSPCDCHWQCSQVSPFGNTDGFSEADYRIAREISPTPDGAAHIEAEREAKFPTHAFSIVQSSQEWRKHDRVATLVSGNSHENPPHIIDWND